MHERYSTGFSSLHDMYVKCSSSVWSCVQIFDLAGNPVALPTSTGFYQLRRRSFLIYRFGGQEVGEACTRYPVHNAVKSGFFNLYFLFCLSWTNKWKSAYSFLSLGSYLNIYHGYASLKNEHFLPVFTEKRALFQHILRDAKSTKCELKEHLWEGAIYDIC